MSWGTPTTVRKRVDVPAAGQFFTDGDQLIEVVRKHKDGWRVRDVTAPLNSPTGLLLLAELPNWRRVEPEADHAC